MAAAEVGTMSISDQILVPFARTTYNFSFADFLKREYRFSLDAERPVCKAFQQGRCPLDEAACPDKHQYRSNYNNLVCKHWLRGLCKKGDSCEFLHEYNLRMMPECTHYARHVTCPNGPDCLYLHIDPASKAPPCPHYDRGFCPLGPYCAAPHVKLEGLCPYYVAGFCPNGRVEVHGKGCDEGAHPVWRETKEMKKPEVRVELSVEEKERRREESLLRLEKEREDDSRDFLERPLHERRQQSRVRGKKNWQNRQRRDRY